MKYTKWSFTTVPNLEQLKWKNPILQTIYLWICKYCNEDGYCFPSQVELSNNCWISVDSCRRYLKELENIWVLARERRYKNNEEITSIYALIVGGSTQPVPPSTQPVPPSTERDGTKSSKLNSLTKDYSKEEIKNFLENNKYNKKEIIKIEETDNLETKFKKTLSLFIDFRKKIKKPIVEESQQAFKNKLMKMANNNPEIAIEILNNSLANWWQWIFEIKENFNTNKQKIWIL